MGAGLTIFIFSFVCGFSSCTGDTDPADESERPPNLVVVTIDTLRVDHVGCYGYFRDTTPNLDRLASEGLVFEDCATPVAQTLPSHTTLFTGLNPVEHGIESNVSKMNAQYVPSQKIDLLAAHLNEEGYHTAAFVSATPVGNGSGLDVGFDVWSAVEKVQVVGGVTVRNALEWLDSSPPEPFFLWVHLFDPHGPYLPPGKFKSSFKGGEEQLAYFERLQFNERLSRAHKHDGEENWDTLREHDYYDGEIRYADEHLGKLFARLREGGRGQRTAFVVTSDHGESLMQHDFLTHQGMWREQLAVPLIFVGPGVAPGRRDVEITTRDILPTLAGLVPELPLAGFLDQCSGTDVLAGNYVARPRISKAPPNPAIRTHLGNPNYLRDGIEHEGWRLILDAEGNAQLYHLEVDPGELVDLAASEPERVKRLRELLMEIQIAEHLTRERLGAGKTQPMNQERLEYLKSLGYVGGAEDEDDEHDH